MDRPSVVSESDPTAPPARARVLQAWDHFNAQRPLAAWAAWQQVLRRDPGDLAARQALGALAKAPNLPEAARATYRFRLPGVGARRARWDALLLAAELDELDAAADVFAHLYAVDPSDAAAGYNHALCLAWLGHNAPAVEVLMRVAAARAVEAPAEAIEALMLGEVLRQGGGAETFADELNHRWVVAAPAAGPIEAWVAEREASGSLRPRSLAQAPAPAGARAWEWLDRPLPAPEKGLQLAHVPRVLASVIWVPGEVRVIGPDPIGLARIGADLPGPARREATPLPLVMLDAAAWAFRLPEGLDDADRRRLAQTMLDHYYQQIWVNVPRHALGGRTPIAAALAAEREPLARAAIEAVLRFRQQVDARSLLGAELGLHADFPALRRRLGVGPVGDTSEQGHPPEPSA